MIISRDLRPALPRRTMGIDQSLRVDFEMGARRGVDVAGGKKGDDIPAPPQQDAATFMGQRIGSLSHQILDKPACDSQFHRAWPYHA